MASKTKTAMETEVSPVVSTNSDLSSPEEDKFTLTPLSLEFDPLSWKLEEKNKSNNSNNSNSCSPEHCSAPVLTDKMTDSVQSFDLITMDDECDTNQIFEDKCEPLLDLTEESEPTLNTNSEPISWPNDPNVHLKHESGADYSENDVTLSSSSVSYNENEYEIRSTNECQIASVSSTNTLSDDSTHNVIVTDLMFEPIDERDQTNETENISMLDIESAKLIATKLVSECVSKALHENYLLNSSSSTSSLSERISSDSDESAQSISSASSGSTKRKKKNTKKKASMAAKPSVPHEQQITTATKTNSIEANKKSVDNLLENHVDNRKNENTKPEINGHAVNGDEKSSFNTEQEMDGGVKTDKKKAQNKFAQGVKDDESLCKVCTKHVYQMEKIKAEKCVFHKSCFRCKECNKQLNVDNYSSHEGELYCTPHFKQLFQPKAKFDTDDTAQTKIDEIVYVNSDLRDQKGRQRKYEMIIRENTPQELPPDVVRSNSKVDDDFDSLQLDLINIRNRFESGCEENHTNSFSVSDKSSLQRSESIHARMQKYQSAASGEKDSSYLSSDEEEKEEKNTPEREKVVFSGMSSLKSQWETGKINSNKEDHDEDTKEELAKLRQKLSLGRSESMKQTYERACKESNVETAPNRSDAVVLDSSVKTVSIKEKFEKGNVDNETEEERIERLKKEREEEINIIAESETTSKEARNKFKQIDASVAKGGPLSPTSQQPLVNGLTKHKVSETGEVVKSGESLLDDVTIDSAQLQERFTYFENFKEAPKEPKRFQITPPRDVQEVVENNAELYRDPNVVRSCDVIEDIPKVDTAKKMLDKFKALENQKDNQSIGLKPLKRITPPRECTADSEAKNHEPSPERDPNIIRSSLKNDDIQVEPEKARSLKAKFENWSLEIDRENKKNSNYDDEEEFIPHIDTTKNLRAKFEAIQDENKPVDKPKQRVNRFV